MSTHLFKERVSQFPNSDTLSNVTFTRPSTNPHKRISLFENPTAFFPFPFPFYPAV